MGRLQHSLAVVAIAALAVSCARVRPSVVPQAARVWGVDLSGVIVRTELDVYNPNRFALNVAAVSGTITLAGQVPLGSATVPTMSHLPARGWQHVTADMKLPWLNLPGALALAGTQTMVPYVFDGNASIGGKLRVTVPFQVQGEVPAQELMRAGMTFPFGASAAAPSLVRLAGAAGDARVSAADPTPNLLAAFAAPLDAR
jgi:LEA14-like dessication related protein